MICQLCKEEKKLCKAHLVPESFFRYLYPSGKVEEEALKKISSTDGYIKRSWTGIYDDNILCADCDNKLGEFDNYGRYLFLESTPEIFMSSGKDSAYYFQDADIDKLTLFILSILWRFSISNLPETQTVQFKGRFGKKLFEIINQRNKNNIHEFSIVITRFKYHSTKKSSKQYFQFPERHRLNGINYIKFYLPNGYKIFIKVDSRDQPAELVPLTLGGSDKALIIGYELFEGSHEHKRLLKHLIKHKDRI
jgi:hypothetical protein